MKAGGAGGCWHTLTPAAACALLAVCLGGCGGGAKPAASLAGARPLSKAQYSRQMTVIGKTFQREVALIATAPTIRAEQLTLTRLEGELGVTETKLRAIVPPAPIQADHARLVEAIGEFEAELGPLIAKLKSGAITDLGTIPVPKGEKDIFNAVAAINKAGYNIG